MKGNCRFYQSSLRAGYNSPKRVILLRVLAKETKTALSHKALKWNSFTEEKRNSIAQEEILFLKTIVHFKQEGGNNIGLIIPLIK